MSARGFAIHIERIDLAAVPPGGERRLREAVMRALAKDFDAGRIAGGTFASGALCPDDIAGQIRSTVADGVNS